MTRKALGPHLSGRPPFTPAYATSTVALGAEACHDLPVKRYGIQYQIAALVTLTIAITVSVLFALALNSTSKLLAAQEASVDDSFLRSVRAVLDSRLDQADVALRLIAADPEFQRLLAERERGALRDHLAISWEALQGVVQRLHVHLPGSVSFIRMHDPDRFGDDLSKLRPMVMAANARMEVLRGLEVGVHGLSQRVILPVTYKGEHVGSVEFGLPFDHDQLAAFRERRDADYFLYLVEEEDVRLLASTTDDNPCIIDAGALETILAGEVYSTSSCSFRDHVLAIPLPDYSGQVVAYMKVVSDRSELESGLRVMRYRLSMLALVATLLLPMVVWSALGRLLRPLGAIVEQTRGIADRIAGGDRQHRGDVAASAPDFRDIIVEINRIIAALRASEVQKQAILDGFPGMLYLVDAELTVVWANAAALLRRPEMVGKNCHTDFDGDEFLSCEQCVLLDAIGSGRIERGSSWFSSDGRGGSECWEYAAVPISAVGGAVQEIVMIAWDVTEKMRAQEGLRELNETLEERVREEIRARELQEQMLFQQAKLAAIGELAAGIAHEVNQPLNTLSFAFENLARRVSDSCVDESELDAKRQTIADSLARIRHILDHVRSFSREQLRDFREPFDVTDAVRHALTMVEAQFSAHGVELRSRFPENAVCSVGNGYELEQVILNVLSNARYAVEHRMPGRDDAPFVDVDVSADSDWGCVTVGDNGDGIPEGVRERVLDPFFTTKGPQDGTGLGLSIAFGIVDKMGGRLAIESESGRGTRVSIVVPRVEGS